MSTPLDARFALLTTESLLKNRTASLSQYDIPGLDPLSLRGQTDFFRPRSFYQLIRIGNRILYAYPHGSCVLSLPFVALLDVFGFSPAGNARTYDTVAEALLEKLLASLLMALAAAAFFDIGLEAQLPIRWSLILAISGALGSQIWSSASRTLWSQTWEVLLASLVVLMIFRAKQKELGWRSYWLATILAWMFFVRPTAAVAIIGITVYLWSSHRAALLSYMSVLSTWIVIFIVYWYMVFGQLLPDYYRLGSSLDPAEAAVVLPAVLISPSRGLLVFVPTIPLLVYLLARYWNLIDHRLAGLALGIIGGHLLIVAASPTWWGGLCYGPRLLTETIPWFVLLAAMACRCVAHETSRNKGLLRIGLALLVLAIVINGWGAVSWKTFFWNGVAAGKEPGVFWDWHHPQFLAGL